MSVSNRIVFLILTASVAANLAHGAESSGLDQQAILLAEQVATVVQSTQTYRVGDLSVSEERARQTLDGVKSQFQYSTVLDTNNSEEPYGAAARARASVIEKSRKFLRRWMIGFGMAWLGCRGLWLWS